MKLRLDMGFTVAANAQKFAVVRALESVLAGVCKTEVYAGVPYQTIFHSCEV